MNSPLKTYMKNSSNASRMRKNSSKEFKRLYLGNTRLNEKNTLGATNEGKLVLKKAKFIPGRIYVYSYDPLYKDILSFYDTTPLVLIQKTWRAKGTGNHIVSGINLNFLPEVMKAQLLEVYWKMFKSEIEKIERGIEDDKLVLNSPKIMSFFNNFPMISKVFDSSNKLGYSFAYRNYIISRIKNLNYVELQDWEMIPFINPQPMHKKTIGEIYELYWNSRTNN